MYVETKEKLMKFILMTNGFNDDSSYRYIIKYVDFFLFMQGIN